MNVGFLLTSAAQRFGTRPAIRWKGHSLTFNECLVRANRLARALLANDFRPGDRIAVLAPNSIEATDALLGLAVGGFVRVPLYARNSGDAHLEMLKGSDCRGLIISRCLDHRDPGLVTRVRQAGVDVIVLDGMKLLLGSDLETSPPSVRISPEDLHVIRHTGGTTGRPRPVGYSHRQWIDIGRSWFYDLPRVEPGDPFFHACPVSHGSGYCFLPVWLAGGINVLQPDFDSDAMLENMAGSRNAMTFLVPTMLKTMVERAVQLNMRLADVKCVQVASAPVAPRTLLEARDIFGDCVYQLYGQTEALPVTLLAPSDWTEADAEDPALSSVGRPLPFAAVEVRSLENPRQPVSQGEVGEVAVRCPGQMTGFLNPSATSSGGGGDERVIDNWIMTGDVGRFTQDGLLTLIDRRGQMIISGGYNIWPAEIEAVLNAVPGVRESAVFGVPSSRWGEAPYAVCAVAEEQEIDAQSLIDLCALRLGSYRKPVEVELRSTPLPKTAVGKLDRESLRRPFWESGERFVGTA